MGFPGGSVVKNPSVKVGVADEGSIPRSGRSLGEGPGNPFQYSCLESPCGQRGLVGYSPRGHKDLDKTHSKYILKRN